MSKALKEIRAIPTQKPKLTTYLDEEVLNAVEAEAAQERRSRAQMMALLIEEALIARGHKFRVETKQE